MKDVRIGDLEFMGALSILIGNDVSSPVRGILSFSKDEEYTYLLIQTELGSQFIKVWNEAFNELIEWRD